MLLNGNQIIQAREAGEIVIDPYDERNVNTGSYDCCLGPWFYRQVAPTTRPKPFAEYRRGIPPHPARNDYNLYSQQHIDSTWKLHRAEPLDRSATGIESDDLVIWIEPQEIILTHTLEFIGSVQQPDGRPISVTTQMHSRSSSVRNCIDVCGSGGWGDHGFCSRWTMEVINHSSRYRVPLVVGRRLAQISFFRTEPIARDYAQEGKYHYGQSLAELRSTWRPHMMLPSTPTDREVSEGTPHKKLVRDLLDTI